MSDNWADEAVHLWVRGETVREIAETLGQPLDAVAELLGHRTSAAVEGVLRHAGWK